jgi:hypothetical protein
MRERIWYELTQAKHHNLYCVHLLSFRRQILNIFNIIILGFSTGGIMGWAVWKDFPLASCIIIATISLFRLLQPHLIPSDKQIDKLDQVADFYFDYYNKLEPLWLDIYYSRISDTEAQAKFYKIKSTEKSINKTVTEIIKRTNKQVLKKTEFESRAYFKNNFNTQ